MPLAGRLDRDTIEDGTAKRIRIRRAHLRKTRAGPRTWAPIAWWTITAPACPSWNWSRADIRSGAEAWAYLTAARHLRLGIASGNRRKPCAARSISRGRGQRGLWHQGGGQNLNSFRSVRQSIDYEIKRQAAILDTGGQVEQVTMGWDEYAGRTVAAEQGRGQRHRYFPEPDLPVVRARRWVTNCARLPSRPTPGRNG